MFDKIADIFNFAKDKCKIREYRCDIGFDTVYRGIRGEWNKIWFKSSLEEGEIIVLNEHHYKAQYSIEFRKKYDKSFLRFFICDLVAPCDAEYAYVGITFSSDLDPFKNIENFFYDVKAKNTAWKIAKTIEKEFKLLGRVIIEDDYDTREKEWHIYWKSYEPTKKFLEYIHKIPTFYKPHENKCTLYDQYNEKIHEIVEEIFDAAEQCADSIYKMLKKEKHE